MSGHGVPLFPLCVFPCTHIFFQCIFKGENLAHMALHHCCQGNVFNGGTAVCASVYVCKRKCVCLTMHIFVCVFDVLGPGLPPRNVDRERTCQTCVWKQNPNNGNDKSLFPEYEGYFYNSKVPLLSLHQPYE